MHRRAMTYPCIIFIIIRPQFRQDGTPPREQQSNQSQQPNAGGCGEPYLCAPRLHKARKDFDMMDTDGDGVATIEEYEAVKNRVEPMGGLR